MHIPSFIRTFRLRAYRWWYDLRANSWRILLSVLISAVALWVNLLAGLYVTYRGGVEVPDLILSAIPVIDLTPIVNNGFIAVGSALVVYPFFFRVYRLHYVIFQFAFLSITRSLFMVLTHLETPEEMPRVMFTGFVEWFNFRNDLFFSGHVAFAFLGFLLFDNKWIRAFFLGMTLLQSFAVLAMHSHYSIDVFAAFYITFGTVCLGRWITRRIGWFEEVRGRHTVETER